MGPLRTFFRHHRRSLLLLLATWGLYFIVIFSRLITLGPDGLWVGHPSVYSDWALHIGIANIFASKDPSQWFAYHPLIADGKFTYPFGANIISALLMRAGLSLPLSFIVPSIVTVLLLLLGMYCLYYQTLRSQTLSLGAITLFLLASGFGFVRLVSNPDIFSYYYQNFSSYNHHDWYTGNFIDGMLLPQRSLLLGMLLAVWSLVSLLSVLQHNQTNRRGVLILVGGGVLMGVLPVVHPHSFIALSIIVAVIGLAAWRQWRRLRFYLAPMVLLAVPLYLTYIRGGIENQGFIHWQLGWTATSVLDWLKQWTFQWGIMIPVAGIALVLAWHRISPLFRAYYASFFIIFILANLFLFQPVNWDNSKLFLWVYFGFAGLAAFFLDYLWRSRGLGMKIITYGAIFLLTCTGVLEVARIQWIAVQPIQLSSAEDIELGQFVRASTDPLARFLTGQQHNNPVMMWGARPIILGYTTWAWNFGFDSKRRERDVRDMFSGSDASLALLRDYMVSYVVIGPTERNDLSANEPYFAERFPLIYDSRLYKVYDTRTILAH